jgi:tRNA U34 5-methylaminomethyl-2-thiouridine-forming methyltransferase MnmC
MNPLYPVKTRDGSFTLYSEKYAEHYHSRQSGAYNETMHKHVIPAIDHILKNDPAVISILDICFGLGYNTIATLYYLDQKGYRGDVEIYSPELDEELVRSLALLPYPKELLSYLPVIHLLSRQLHLNTEFLNITVLIGDAVAIVRDTAKKFDIVYQDAFSRKNNPELWSEAYFADLFNLLNDGGILTTYSRSKGVRKIMKACGFTLYAHDFPKTLSVRPGTLAVKNATLPLDELDLG